MLKETKKDLFISFWQLLRKRNLLLFCSCNNVMFHYVCLSRSLWLGYVFMFTHPDQVVTAVTFSSLVTKWIRFSERGKKELLQIYWYIYSCIYGDIWQVNIYERDMVFSGYDGRSHIRYVVQQDIS